MTATADKSRKGGGSEVRELGRDWGFKETTVGCKRFWQIWEAPEKRNPPGEIWTRWRQAPVIRGAGIKKGPPEDVW